ncbi:hypothetical protein B0H19DRAFT_1072800 [Mycena capillaripes]|nr:hypothetical protein B0H19DRAFT_1072800 [Mycena capillaripes]
MRTLTQYLTVIMKSDSVRVVAIMNFIFGAPGGWSNATVEHAKENMAGRNKIWPLVVKLPCVGPPSSLSSQDCFFQALAYETEAKLRLTGRRFATYRFEQQSHLSTVGKMGLRCVGGTTFPVSARHVRRLDENKYPITHDEGTAPTYIFNEAVRYKSPIG